MMRIHCTGHSLNQPMHKGHAVLNGHVEIHPQQCFDKEVLCFIKVSGCLKCTGKLKKNSLKSH